MKIAFLTPEYPHVKTGSAGGIGTSIKNLAIGLMEQGCSVRVLVYGQKEEGVFDDNGICIQQIRNVKLKGLSWWLTRKKLERIINQLYANQEIDLVEAADWTGITSFIQPKKCPIVIRLNGSDTYFCHLDQRPVKWVNKFHERRALQKANSLISVSQFTADLTNEVFGLNKTFTIIPNGIDTTLFSEKDNNNVTKNSDTFHDLTIPPSLSFGEGGGEDILYFGSLIRKKGLLELPLIFNEVVQKNPEAKLILIGKDVPDIISGNTSTWAMMQLLFSEQAFKNVSYLGSVPYAEIQIQIERATVCVFPSFAEALPVSWLEAMAMRKAVVASNIGWATDIIENRIEGFLVNPKEHQEYANRILDLLENPELQNQLGVNARKKIVDKFSMKVVAKQSLLFYKDLIKKNKKCN
jgi:glycosyltransferase involved in cell wall biosynthesis